MRQVLVIGVVFFHFLVMGASADNWPHWRGDLGNSVSLTAKPPVRWNATSNEAENIRWKTPLPGRGSGSPVVWEDKIFVVTAVGGNGVEVTSLKFKLLCIDRKTGKLNWERQFTEATPHQATHSTNGFASASPCTDGEHVYAHFGSRGIFCCTIDGKPVWERSDLGRMQTRNDFGEGSSPTLVDDMIIIPWDHEGDSYITALDKKTGKTIWKTPRDEPTCWATPLIVETPTGKQVVMNGQTCARSYDLASGKELWRCGGQTQRPVACAVAADGLVYVGSGFRGSFMAAFRLDGRGDIANTSHVVWSVNENTPDIASPVLSQGRLYYHKAKSGVITCVDAKTGKVLFGPARLPGLRTIYASPVAAGGYVYFTGRSGNTVVIRDAAELKIVAENRVGETVDATPAPVDDELFIRGENHLFCIGG